MNTVDIIALCGGKAEVAYRCGKLHTHTVERWPRYGIPLDYWDTLIALAKERGHRLTLEDLYAANRLAATSAE